MTTNRNRVRRLSSKKLMASPWIVIYKDHHKYFDTNDNEISAAQFANLLETENTIVFEYVDGLQLPKREVLENE